jgi:hypothetical protein
VGEKATKRQVEAAQRWMDRIRQEMRARLSLKP